MTLTNAKDLATIVGAIFVAITFVKSVVEYTKQGAQKRAELFSEMRIRFKNDKEFRKICDWLEDDNEGLRAVPFKEKRDFLGFFEEIALMMNSGLIRRPVAHYMFGYYAIRCWESDNFWVGVNRDSGYWSLFTHFVDEMKEIERSFQTDNSSMRF